MGDRIELDVFAVKDDIRYKIKTITMDKASEILTDSIFVGIGKIIGAIDNKVQLIIKERINNEYTNNM